MLTVAPGHEYTLTVLVQDGDVGERSRRAMTVLRDRGVSFGLVEVAHEQRHRHPATVSTGFFLFPQLLYKNQLLGSLEFIEEWTGRSRQATGSGTAVPAWSMDVAGGLCATAGADGRVRMHREGSLELVSVARVTNTWLNTVRAVGGDRFVTGGPNGSLYEVWPNDVVATEVVAGAHSGWLNAAAYDHSTDLVFTGGSDGWIRAWRPSDWSPVREWRTPDAWVNALVARDGMFWAALSSGQIVGGRSVHSPSDDPIVIPVSQRCLNTIDLNSRGEVVVAGYDGNPALVRPREEAVTSLHGDCHVGGVWGARFVGDDNVLTAGSDGRLLRWQPFAGKTATILALSEPLIALSKSGEGAIVFTRGRGPTGVKLGGTR